jgi:oligoendopeptidase F
MKQKGSEGVSWDLSFYYPSSDAPAIEEDLERARRQAEAFSMRYRQRIKRKGLAAPLLLSALKAYESIHESAMRPYGFASLQQAADVADHEGNVLLERVRTGWYHIRKDIRFFESEIQGIDSAQLSALADEPALEGYRHYLLRALSKRPHILPEDQERIIELKHLSGRTALLAMYDAFMGTRAFCLEVEGKAQSLGRDQILSLLHHRDRDLRQHAFSTMLNGLGQDAIIFQHLLNAISRDEQLEAEERGYKDAMERACLANEVDRKVVDRLMDVTEAHYPLARRYFRAKARALGLRKLHYTDQLAPLRGYEASVHFQEARDRILEAFQAFDPLFHDCARRFFDERRIDAEIRPGKQGGCFCRCYGPWQPPYVLMHFTGTLRDLTTLAHELGHGIHDRLASTQTYLNFQTPPVLAETASTFFETLVVEHLLGKKGQQDLHLLLLAGRIEDAIITVFRQNVLTRFERALYGRRKAEFLSTEAICHLWIEHNQRLYGEDLEMDPAYRWGWTMVPHFFHLPFYCFSYVFGYLVSLCLRSIGENKGQGFSKRVARFLGAGASRSPMELVRELGLDPSEHALWERGFQVIDRWIDDFEGMISGPASGSKRALDRHSETIAPCSPDRTS